MSDVKDAAVHAVYSSPIPVVSATRYHDISCGHRVVGHGGKCVGLHGHNYRIHFTVTTPTTDALGMVVDFSVIKDRLCNWLEENWDHKMLLWENDPMAQLLLSPKTARHSVWTILEDSIVKVPFNPTAENIAKYLVEHLGPKMFHDLPNIRLAHVRVDETRKCSASYEVSQSSPVK